MIVIRNVCWVLIFLWTGTAWPAAGQDGRSPDERLLRQIYAGDADAFAATMRAFDVTSYALFAAVPAGTFAYAYAADRPDLRAPAYRIALSEAAALAGVVVLKRLYARPRPYAELDGIRSRAVGLDRWVLSHDTLSFPSGHAALSFAVATSVALSGAEWYVTAAAFVWAGAVATSRLWLGVHYPTDVLAGAAIGAAAGAGVHLLRHHVTPAWIAGRDASPVSIRLSIAL